MKKLAIIVILGTGVTIFLPIAGLSVNAYLIIGVGSAVGFLSGLLGVGGGFLLTPILIMIGVPATVAAASDTNSIVATSSSGVATHFRLKNVDLRMGMVALVGGLVGSAVGVYVIELLQQVGNANLVITLTYILMLGGVGGFMLWDSIVTWRKGMIAARRTTRSSTVLSRLPWQMDFPRSGVRHSFLIPFGLCVIVGLMTAIMGVGGGFMLIPVMVYLLGMPAHVAVGTSLFQILFTCMGTTIMQANTNHTVDIVLAILVAAGSTIGAQIGARMSRWLRGEQLLGLLGILALVVMLKMAVIFTMPPSNLLKKPSGPAAFAIPAAPALAGQSTRRAGTVLNNGP